MQIKHVEVVPVRLSLQHPVQMAQLAEINEILTIFVRMETSDGRNAWGCAVAHPELTGEKPESALFACREGAALAPDLHPLNIEFSLARMAALVGHSPAAMCAFDLAFHDLLGLAAGLPLYRLLGGYRNRIETSATVPVVPEQESVEIARHRASLGFRILKIKAGCNPDEDVQRVKAIRRALPFHVLRLDADGSYTVQDALDVARALQDELEMLEQPTPANDLQALREVTASSPVPVMADQSVRGPASAFELAASKAASGLSIKMAACGGFQCARQIDAIARAARISSMVGCVIEPALMIAAGLSFALSSPNVHFGDLDGHMDLIGDPTQPGFRLEEGFLVASDVPGLGCTVNLG